MRFSIPLLALLPLIAAAHFKRQSQCVLTCLSNTSSAASAVGCGASEIACLCKNPSVVEALMGCMRETCSEAAVEPSIQYGIQVCTEAGVTLDQAVLGGEGARPSASSSGPPSASATSASASASLPPSSSSSASSTSTSAAAASASSSGGALPTGQPGWVMVGVAMGGALLLI